jgi:hypothetical protein
MSSVFLKDIVDNSRTDKNTIHSYLDIYDLLFNRIQFVARNVLEVGIQRGGSMKLWSDYFMGAKIFGLDIMNFNEINSHLIKDDPRIVLYTGVNAYDPSFVTNSLSHTKYDVMIDDGPHTLESMKQFIHLYVPLMSEIGILVIEDVQDISWIRELISCVPDNLKQYVQVFDLRYRKNRRDDIIFAINKIPIYDS